MLVKPLLPHLFTSTSRPFPLISCPLLLSHITSSTFSLTSLHVPTPLLHPSLPPPPSRTSPSFLHIPPFPLTFLFHSLPPFSHRSHTSPSHSILWYTRWKSSKNVYLEALCASSPLFHLQTPFTTPFFLCRFGELKTSVLIFWAFNFHPVQSCAHSSRQHKSEEKNRWT